MAYKLHSFINMVQNIVNQTTLKKGDSKNHSNIQNGQKGSFNVALTEAIEDHAASGSVHKPNIYKVKKGDNLTKIVKKFTGGSGANVSELVHKLAKSNDITNPNLIYEGQSLDVSSLVAMTKKETSFQGKAEIFAETHLSKNSHESSLKLLELIRETSVSHGISPYISLAIARTESGTSASHDKKVSLNPHSVNGDSKAKGIFQLMDKTGERFHKLLKLGGEYDPFDIKQNVKIGINYIKYLDKIFAKDTVLTGKLNTIAIKDPLERKYFSIAAFNSGEGRVAQAQQKAKEEGKDPTIFKNVEKHLPSQTRAYLIKVGKFVDMLA